MKSALQLALLASMVFTGPTAGAPSFIVGTHDLQATVEFNTALHIHVATLKNITDQFVCVSSNLFNPPSNSIGITGPDGRSVVPDQIVDSVPNRLHGFELGPPYVFIPPYGERPFYVEIGKSFFVAPGVRIKPGAYRYHIEFSYYRCRDILLAEEGRDVPTRHISMEGDLHVPAK